MPRLRFCSLILLLASIPVKAEIISPNLPGRSLGFGLSTLHVEQPDSNSEQRYRWDLHEYIRLPWWNLRMHDRFGIARDTRPRADSLQVHHHFYELAATLQWTGTKLFRYGFGAGPLLLLEETVTRVQLEETKQRTDHRLQLGAVIEAQLDYAFNTSWELGLIAALQLRPVAQKQDFSFGVSLQFNRGGLRKDDNPKPKTPATTQPGPPPG